MAINNRQRIEGADTFFLTRTEASTSLNKGERSVLALVQVDPDDTTHVRYLRAPINTPIDPRSRGIQYEWRTMWAEGTDMTP